MKVFALSLFIVTYVLMIALPKYRPLTAVVSAVIFILSGILPAGQAIGAIDFNVLMMLAGTMGTVSLFIGSKMPNRLAEIILQHTPNVMWVVVAMSLFAGVISAFMDNVATVLMIAPVGLAVAKKLNISPISMLICIAVSSNLQGAATLVGDTTSILLGGYAGMDFTDFFFMDGKPSIFFAVELGALATVFVIMFLFRDQREEVSISDRTEVTDYFPTVLLVGTVVLLIAASFIPNKPDITNGVICLVIFAIGAIRSIIRTHSMQTFRQAIRDVDFQTLILFVRVGGDNLFLLYTIIVWGSVLVSAFVDNIPYVATMLPVVTSIANTIGIDPMVLYFGLLSGATLGGNLTPIGASANITAIGILRKVGYEVKTSDFVRIGLPFTLCAVTAGYLFIWFVWA